MANKSSVAAAAVFLVLSQATFAGELYTPPLMGRGGGTCSLINLGAKTIDVRIEVRGAGGNILTEVDTFADPGWVTHTSPTAYFVSTIGYCAFFFDGPNKNVRASYTETGPSPDFPLTVVVRAE